MQYDQCSVTTPERKFYCSYHIKFPMRIREQESVQIDKSIAFSMICDLVCEVVGRDLSRFVLLLLVWFVSYLVLKGTLKVLFMIQKTWMNIWTRGNYVRGQGCFAIKEADFRHLRQV